TATYTIAAVNDAPTASNLTQPLTLLEDAAAVALFGTAPVDRESVVEGMSVTLRRCDPAAGVLLGAGTGLAGVYTVTGTVAAVNAALALVTFDSAANYYGSAGVAVRIVDGASGPTCSIPGGTVSITVTAVNDAPTASNLTQPLTLLEDAAAVALFGTAP